MKRSTAKPAQATRIKIIERAPSGMPRTKLIPLVIVTCAFGLGGGIARAESPSLFGGEKTAWHGFDRYDFVMDEATLGITPIKAAEDEKDGIKQTVDGQWRCIVVAPKTAARGNPWSWRGCYWDHQPQSEVELLKNGFHVAYIEASAARRPGKHWDAWYAFLTEKHGLSKKPAFVGMSRGGEFAFTWATANPDKVAGIYADNTGSNPEVFGRLGDLARNDVPLLLVCGSIDPVLGRNALAIESMYQQFGGRISIMIKEGAGHHPHSLRDPKPIVDFIVQSVQPSTNFPPAFAGGKSTRSSYYGIENLYCNFPTEGTYVTCRGPEFTNCYDRYAFDLDGVEGATTVIVPKTQAPGKPWVFRSDFVNRDAVVDLALLAKGFHIVTGPVPFNADGPIRAHWDAVYNHLVQHGFSRKPVMEGAGAAVGDAYAWAIENPDKVSCIYGENPVLRSTLSTTPPIDNVAALAKARMPILHVCGSLDPWLNKQTRIVERRYKELGGHFAVIVKEGEGHYPLAPRDPKPAVDFIIRNSLPGNPGLSGLPPLVDLGPGHTYKGQEGGLYPGGSNVRPAAHETAGQKIARSIVPLDRDGNPDPVNGRIVIMPVSVSNGYGAWHRGDESDTSTTFMTRANANPARNPKLFIAYGFEYQLDGGNRGTGDPGPDSIFYKSLDQGLKDQGVNPRQVQIVWLSMPVSGMSWGTNLPQEARTFPADAQQSKLAWKEIVHAIHVRYPNVKIIYSSTKGAMYMTPRDNPEFDGGPIEPWNHDAAWGVKWVIEDQINGAPDLNYDPARGPVKAPWLSWGPYFWSYPNGAARNYDGFIWTRADVGPDLLHPSLSGITKYATMLLRQMTADPTATPWFLSPGAPANQPPTIAKPAKADINPVSGTMTTLSVLGEDDGGESNLTYTWSCSGPADVMFSANGPNKAKNATVTFPIAGRYTFHVTLADNGGLTATSSIVVTVKSSPP